MGYQAGDLNITVKTISQGTIESLDKVIEKLKEISPILSQMSKFTNAGKIAKSFGSSSQTYKIDKLGKSYLKQTSNTEKLDGATKKITRTFNKQGEEVKRVTTEIDKYGKKITNIRSFTDEGGIGSQFNVALAFGKICAVLAGAKRLALVVSQILDYGVDYTETLNLWQVAMNDNLSMAREFVNTMNKAYGISEKTLMNAQAIFKNMIGSLGQISESAAYTLSEALTKMAVDYSSLYNVSIESAITKFEAALAGQVRPIRSTSGYDITENTLYQLYQAMGGTKTVRQLSRTEKQLLSIYAIFNQMGASGALGDMEKTIDEVANQTRMMKENFQQAATWLGVSIEYAFKKYGIFKQINAALIFSAEVLKAIAYSLGYEEPDFATGWADNVTETEKAVDDLQGKLLGFDKFRSLSSAEENVLGIDEKLLEALKGYTSEIGNAGSEARQLAEEWMTIFGFVDENGDGVWEITQKAKDLLDVVKAIGIWVALIFGMGLIGGMKKFVVGLAGITTAAKLFSTVLLSGAIYSLLKFIEAIKNADEEGMIFYGGALAFLTLGWIALNKEIIKTTLINISSFFKDIIGYFKNLTQTINSAGMAMSNLQISFFALGTLVVSFGILYTFLDGLDEKTRKWASALFVVLGVAAAIYGAIAGGLVGAISMAAGTGAVLAVIQSQAKVQKYKNGGMPDKGTLFIAGESGAEIVATSSNGQTGVTNVQQIQQAMYNALVAYGRTQGGNGQEIVVYLDGEKVYQNTTAHAKRRGNSWAKA